MKTLQEEREAIVELKEDVRFLTVQAWREEKSVSDVTDEIMKLLLSHEEKVVARALTQIARIPKMEFKMSDVQEALTLPITDESV